MRMAQEDLHGFEQVPLRYEADSKRSSATVAAIPPAKTCRSVQARDVVLQAVSGKILHYPG